MFEAIVALCLAAGAGPCRDQLIPGYEAPTEAACIAALARRFPTLDWIDDPGAVRCVPAGAALEVTEVAPGVFVHKGQIAEPNSDNRGDVSNMGFVIGDRSVAVIDTGAARWLGEGLWRAIRARTGKPVSHVILTHMHPDHVFGVSVFADAGAQVVGHGGLPRALADRQQNYRTSFDRLIGPGAMIGSTLEDVDLPVTEMLQIDLGTRTLQVQAWPSAHTHVDVTVTDRTSGILFAGDLMFHRHTPALDGSVLGWRAVLAALSDLEVTHVVPGHGGPLLDWPEGGAAQAQYLKTLETDTRQAIAAGTRLGQAVQTIARSEADDWELFDAFNPRNATQAYTELEWE